MANFPGGKIQKMWKAHEKPMASLRNYGISSINGVETPNLSVQEGRSWTNGHISVQFSWFITFITCKYVLQHIKLCMKNYYTYWTYTEICYMLLDFFRGMIPLFGSSLLKSASEVVVQVLGYPQILSIYGGFHQWRYPQNGWFIREKIP